MSTAAVEWIVGGGVIVAAFIGMTITSILGGRNHRLEWVAYCQCRAAGERVPIPGSLEIDETISRLADGIPKGGDAL